jgi:1,4-dihydroxy-2-naphthoyl-CoA hydrolase
VTDVPDRGLLPQFPRDMGVVLIETGPDLVVGALEVGPAHGNRNGVMHGGAVMAFADALGGVAASLNLSGEARTTTIESKTNFLRAVPLGTRITGRCVPVHKGRKTTIWQTTVVRADGKPAAITIQTQMTLVWSEDRPAE